MGDGHLYERGAELDMLRSAWARAGAGRGGLIIVEGAAGNGKSTLLAATAEEAAASGLRVLRARGSELERGLAFGVVRQLFELVLAVATPAGRADLLAGAAAAAERVLAPDSLGAAPVSAAESRSEERRVGKECRSRWSPYD